MSSIKLKGSSSGDVTITVPAAAGTNTVTIPAATGNLPLSNLDHVTNRQTAKPLIINGDMQVAQRGTSVTGITGSGYQTVDRMNFTISGLGTWTQTQDTTVPTAKGFTKSLKMDCTTADGSPAAGDFCLMQYKIEAQDLQMLKYGTSSAEAFTLRFHVRSPKTGTHIVHIYQNDGARHISKAYTISSADTFQEVIINIPGDTGGTINNDNDIGLQIEFFLAAGSNSTSGTLATSWAGYTQANAAVGQVNCADSTDNNWYITGLQMEVGEFDSTTIPPFQHELFGDNLRRCERYCQKSYPHEHPPGTVTSGDAGRDFVYLMGGSTDPHIMVKFRPEMRITPTVTTYSTANANTTGKMTAGATDASAGTNAVVNSSYNFMAFASSVTASDDVYVAWLADAEL